jgi:hypothetical protein
LEQCNRIGDSIAHRIERSNAWLAFHRPVRTKDYLNGQAYLEWRVTFPALGRWHELFCVAKKVDAVFDIELGVVGSRKVSSCEIACASYHEKSPVFVDHVEFVKANKATIPSWVWLQVSHLFDRQRAGFPGFVFDPFLELIPVGDDGKAGIVGTAPLSDSASRNDVIQCRAQAMHCISDDEGCLTWDRFRERYVEPVLACVEVEFFPNAVRVASKPTEDLEIRVSDVRLRTMQL